MSHCLVDFLKKTNLLFCMCVYTCIKMYAYPHMYTLVPEKAEEDVGYHGAGVKVLLSLLLGTVLCKSNTCS